MSMPEYELRRTDRRTLSIEINREAKLIVHAPLKMSLRQIESFIASKQGWIEDKQAKAKAKQVPELSDGEISYLKEKAHSKLTARTEYYAALLGVTPTRVRINGAKTRLGSCSRKGSINYSWRLMLYPKDAWDYVVVHELCHLKHFNHGEQFWKMVENCLPDYKTRALLLK